MYYDDTSVVIRPEVAKQALEKSEATVITGPETPGDREHVTTTIDESVEVRERRHPPKRFYGTAKLNPLRISSEAGTISQEVIQHLESLLGSNVEVTIEITAQSTEGFPDNVVRTVTENARTLKFQDFGFEEE